jgi:hydroxysqualene synthase
MPVATKAEQWILHPPKVRTLEDSFRRCKQIARKHYENFPVGSVLIPREMQPYVFAVYAFARTADDFADEPGYSDAERLLYLNEWEDLFHRSLETKTRHPIMWAVSETMRAKDIPPSLFTDLLSAFRQDVSVKRYETFTDVMDYCARSANPIGRLLLLIFGYRDAALFRYSDAICSALQLTNFWQDVSVDLRKDRIYIPQEDLIAYGVDERALSMRAASDALRHLMRFEVERTDALFSMGTPLLKHLRGRFRAEIKCILIGGTSILRKIERQGYDVLRKRPKLGVGDTPRFLGKLLTTF